MSPPLLEMIGVEKSFFGVRVLKGTGFSIPPAGMVGLVGENGAGKSTLMNILGGNLRADAGTMRLDGQPYRPESPQDAARRGVAFIHQELNLFPNLSIAENIFLTTFPTAAGGTLIHHREIHRRAAKLLAEVGLDVPPQQRVETLSTGQRQLVEIAKALSIDARLIIFDEPTTSLSERETARLFGLIARLRARGLAIIYISHALADIFRLCDEVVVLRDGEVVGAGPVKDFTTEKLVTIMVGRTMSQLFPTRRMFQGQGPPVLEVNQLSRRGPAPEVSFTLRRGEVLGLSGLMGAGRSELARALFGLDPLQSGSIRIDGRAIIHPTPRRMTREGVGFLTENRRAEGLCLDGSVAENFTLASLPSHARPPLRWLSRASLQKAVDQIRKAVRLDAKTRPSQTVRTLSGGNQQKVVLGKWLLCAPKALILDEPTRGVDVGAKFEIYRLIHELADGGAGVLVISSEMEELLGICDRILVMRGGALVDDLPRAEFDCERILRAALGTEAPG